MIARPLAALAALALVTPVVADAATKNGITPRSPKAGSTVKVATPPTFKMRVRGKGSVWVHVCKSKRRDKEGVICNKETIIKAKKKRGSLFQVKAKFFDYPEFWLNSPRTYYWQAYRIDCTGNLDDCKREGPITKFKVR